ncbi:hypothetical protein HDV05_005279 [Chytridiales sp. JEL 0842]|nr:hypothetical protein HDV05_005279 [Chytridiales sp. JEL 0842]
MQSQWDQIVVIQDSDPNTDIPFPLPPAATGASGGSNTARLVFRNAVAEYAGIVNAIAPKVCVAPESQVGLYESIKSTIALASATMKQDPTAAVSRSRLGLRVKIVVLVHDETMVDNLNQTSPNPFLHQTAQSGTWDLRTAVADSCTASSKSVFRRLDVEFIRCLSKEPLETSRTWSDVLPHELQPHVWLTMYHVPLLLLPTALRNLCQQHCQSSILSVTNEVSNEMSAAFRIQYIPSGALTESGKRTTSILSTSERVCEELIMLPSSMLVSDNEKISLLQSKYPAHVTGLSMQGTSSQDVNFLLGARDKPDLVKYILWRKANGDADTRMNDYLKLTAELHQLCQDRARGSPMYTQILEIANTHLRPFLQRNIPAPKSLVSTFPSQKIYKVAEFRTRPANASLKPNPHPVERKIESYLRVPPPTPLQLAEENARIASECGPMGSLWEWHSEKSLGKRKQEAFVELDGRKEGMNWDGNARKMREGNFGKLLPIAFD